MKEFRIFGIRRSGNHAIIEWIASHFEHTVHYNDTRGFPPVDWYSIYHYGDTEQKPTCRIFSYEDFEPSLDELDYSDTYMILRDIRNMIASRVFGKRGIHTARNRHSERYDRNVIEVWKKYAELHTLRPNKTILFDTWVSSIEYRSTLAERLGITGGHFILSLPSSGVGGGSSFKERSVTPRSLTKRYLALAIGHPKVWRKLSGNKDLLATNASIFGDTPPSLKDWALTCRSLMRLSRVALKWRWHNLRDHVRSLYLRP